MRGLSSDTKTLITYACKLLKGDHPQTLRQLHYAIFSRKEIAYDNDQASYKRLSRATTAARRRHRGCELSGKAPDCLCIPPEWMVDETRQPEVVSVWIDAAAYAETIKRAYRRDNWQDQVYHCEVWSEKATILGAVRPTADEWGITLRVSHGFGSTGMEQQIGEEFARSKKEIIVFYLGDHDPSGREIEHDIHRRVQAASGKLFTMRRLAIHADDIVNFRLPPQRIKTTDSRADSFRRQFGMDAATVELDALPVGELRHRIEEAVTALIDFEKWKRQVAVQEVELNCIIEFAERIKRLPQMAGGTE
jgi:hypothetical protein